MSTVLNIVGFHLATFQEEINAGLHLCEIVAAVGLLAVGGHFMWKGFTLFEHVSFGSVYIMACLFNEVAVYKPVTSKAANRSVEGL